MSDRVIEVILSSFTKILIPGLTVTIPLAVISFLLAMVIATGTALIRFANVPVLKDLVRFYVWFIRGTPLLVQLYIVFFGFPKIGIVLPAFPCAVVVFALNEGAYCSETIRGSLMAVSEGQIEAGYCVGMSFMQIMMRIVLPQALRSAFPALMNSLIGMVKDTSLAANITVAEMFISTQRIVSRTYEALALYIELAFVYLLFSTVLTKIQGIVEKKLNAQVGK